MSSSNAREPIAVLGAGGHAKVVIAALEAAGVSIGGVFDDDQSRWGTAILGHVVTGPLREASARLRRGILAIGSNAGRRRLAAVLEHEWVAAVHPYGWVHDTVAVGDGTVVMAGAVVQPAVALGRHVIVNTSASIDHDCRIGDFVHIAPGARLAGGVVVGEGALLGVGCSVVPEVEIGAGAMVGAGAVVVRDVPPDATVAGVPARVLARSGAADRS